MKTGFKDPIAPPATEKKKTPWDFRCPEYDQRSSVFVDAGSHYGIGKKNPVGHKEGAKLNADTLPFGRVDTMQTAYIPPKQLDQDYVK